jgi:hypothetical protein
MHQSFERRTALVSLDFKTPVFGIDELERSVTSMKLTAGSTGGGPPIERVNGFKTHQKYSMCLEKKKYSCI